MGTFTPHVFRSASRWVGALVIVLFLVLLACLFSVSDGVARPGDLRWGAQEIAVDNHHVVWWERDADGREHIRTLVDGAPSNLLDAPQDRLGVPFAGGGRIVASTRTVDGVQTQIKLWDLALNRAPRLIGRLHNRCGQGESPIGITPGGRLVIARVVTTPTPNKCQADPQTAGRDVLTLLRMDRDGSSHEFYRWQRRFQAGTPDPEALYSRLTRFSAKATIGGIVVSTQAELRAIDYRGRRFARVKATGGLLRDDGAIEHASTFDATPGHDVLWNAGPNLNGIDNWEGDTPPSATFLKHGNQTTKKLPWSLARFCDGRIVVLGLNSVAAYSLQGELLAREAQNRGDAYGNIVDFECSHRKAYYTLREFGPLYLLSALLKSADLSRLPVWSS